MSTAQSAQHSELQAGDKRDLVEGDVVPEVLSAGFTIRSSLTENTYLIEGLLGEGAFGRVYLCTDQWDNRLAIKRLKPIELGAASLHERASRELQALVEVRSPFIVPILDAFALIGGDEGEICIVSDYCGSTLGQLVATPDFEPIFWFRALARCVLQALHFTKIQGYAHCDIHPGNVFVHFVRDEVLPDDHSAVKFMLGDFGLARPLSDLSVSGTFLDTIRPPEATEPLEFGRLDHRVDIYQAGLLFLHFLVPALPAFSQTDVLKGLPQDVSLALGTPLGNAIARMLRRHVEFRTPTALEAWKEIRSALQS